jgi:hypothetical protein
MSSNLVLISNVISGGIQFQVEKTFLNVLEIQHNLFIGNIKLASLDRVVGKKQFKRNLYINGAKPLKHEMDPTTFTNVNPEVYVIDQRVGFNINLPKHQLIHEMVDSRLVEVDLDLKDNFFKTGSRSTYKLNQCSVELKQVND